MTNGEVLVAPRRLQMSAQAGFRKPEGAVVVTGPSRWSTPFKVKRRPCLDGGYCWSIVNGLWTVRAHIDTEQHAREKAVAMYRSALFAGRLPGVRTDPALTAEQARVELAGHDLLCWCAATDPCHADILLAVANDPEEPC